MRNTIYGEVVFVAIGCLVAACSSGNSRPTDIDLAIAQFDESTSRVAYRIDWIFPDIPPSVGKQVVYKDGPSLRRTEDYTDEPDSKLRQITLVRGTDALECDPTLQPGGVCWPVSKSDIEAGFSTFYLKVYLQDAHDAPDPHRTIAGQAARCYRTTSTDDSEMEICIASDGTLLRLSFGGNGATATWEAVSFSRDVHDSDFLPPYAIDDRPAIPVTITPR